MLCTKDQSQVSNLSRLHTSGASCSGYANPELRRAGRRDHFPRGKVAFLAWFYGETARYAMLWLIAVNVDKRHFIVQQQKLSNRQNLMTQDGGASGRQPLNYRRVSEVGHCFPRGRYACALMSRQPELTVWRIR